MPVWLSLGIVTGRVKLYELRVGYRWVRVDILLPAAQNPAGIAGIGDPLHGTQKTISTGAAACVGACKMRRSRAVPFISPLPLQSGRSTKPLLDGCQHDITT